MSPAVAPPRPFLQTKRLELCALRLEDASESYLGWLNDPEVLRYRTPKAFPSTMDTLKAYISSIPSRGDLVLALWDRETKCHIGNVALNSILLVHRSAELSIMIGDKRAWGRGFGKEAMYAVTRHAFRSMGLHRVWAESPNPSFNQAVRSLGWKLEGQKRDAFRLEDKFVDFECWGILENEFRELPGYHLPA